MAKLKGRKIKGKSDVYELLKHLAGGGNGDVWKSKCNNEYFAVKFLKKEEMKSDRKKKRFLKEIDFLKNNNHKNIVHIFDYGEFDDELFYVMPLYNETLKDVIQEEKTITQIFDYILQVCEGIRYAHNKDIIHRDIKPENILIDKEKLVIADLGIAHFKNSDITEKGELLANRVYAAPEQKKKGSSENVGKSADIL